MRRAISLFLFAAALFAQTAPEPRGRILVVVKDTRGVPADGVSVTLTPTDPGPHPIVRRTDISVGISGSMSSLTDEDGTFAFTAVAPGNYSVTAARNRAGISVSKRLKLDTDQETSIDLVLPATPSIAGRILSQNDEPEVDAFVWLLKPEYQGGALKQVTVGPQVTHSDGSFKFEDLEANRRYYVIVDRNPPDEIIDAAAADLKDREPIEVPTYYPSVTKFDFASPIILLPGERREQLEIKVATAPFFCVAGKLQTAGKPTANSFGIQDVALVGTNLERFRRTPGDDGTFHTCGLTSGSYRLTTDGGFTDFTISSSDRDQVNLSAEVSSLRLTVDWAEPLPPSEIPKPAAEDEAFLRSLAADIGMQGVGPDELFKLGLQITSPNRELQDHLGRMAQTNPAVMASLARIMGGSRGKFDSVNVMLSAGPAVGPSQQIAIPFDGAFRNSISAGDYALNLSTAGPHDAYPKEVTFNGLKIEDRVVHLAPGTSGVLQIRMARDTATLAVNVTDGDRNPVSDAAIIVIPASASTVAALSQVLHGQTNEHGGYTFRKLPPGKYRVLAIPQSIRWGVPEDLEKILLVLFRAKDIDVGPNAKLELAVDLINI